MTALATDLRHTKFVYFDRDETIVVIGMADDAEVSCSPDESMLSAEQVRHLGTLLADEHRVVGMRLENAILDVDALEAVVNIVRNNHRFTSFVMTCTGPPAKEGLTEYPVTAATMVMMTLWNPNIEVFKLADNNLRWNFDYPSILITGIVEHRKLRKLALTHLALRDEDFGTLL